MHVIDVVIFDMQIQTFFMRQGMDVFLVCYLDQFMWKYIINIFISKCLKIW